MLTDLNRAPYSSIAFRNLQVAAAALNLARPLEFPSMVALQALVAYLGGLQLCDSPTASGRTWILAGLAFRIAQAVSIPFEYCNLQLTTTQLGLHRDCLDPALSSEDIQTRRRCASNILSYSRFHSDLSDRVFWQLVTLDAFYSVAFGRPLFFNSKRVSLQHSSCPFLTNSNQTLRLSTAKCGDHCWHRS